MAITSNVWFNYKLVGVVGENEKIIKVFSISTIYFKDQWINTWHSWLTYLKPKPLQFLNLKC